MEAQLLFYPVTEQLFVFNESQVRRSQVRRVPAGRRVRTILRGYKPAVRRVPAVKKIKKDIDICSNQYYIYIIN